MESGEGFRAKLFEKEERDSRVNELSLSKARWLKDYFVFASSAFSSPFFFPLVFASSFFSSPFFFALAFAFPLLFLAFPSSLYSFSIFSDFSKAGLAGVAGVAGAAMLTPLKASVIKATKTSFIIFFTDSPPFFSLRRRNPLLLQN